jgi:hypothetical protein
MKYEEQNEKIENAKKYFGKKVILRRTNSLTVKKEFTLVGYKLLAYGNIRDYTIPTMDVSDYSSSLYGVLFSEELEINTISMAQILTAIDNGNSIDFLF